MKEKPVPRVIPIVTTPDVPPPPWLLRVLAEMRRIGAMGAIVLDRGSETRRPRLYVTDDIVLTPPSPTR